MVKRVISQSDAASFAMESYGKKSFWASVHRV